MTSQEIKKAVFKAELNGALTNLMVRTNVDNVLYEEDGTSKKLSAKLADVLATIAAKADSGDVTNEIKAATDNLYNKIMGITEQDGATVNEAYDTLKEVANYLAAHGSVVQGFTNDISSLQTAVATLQTGMTQVAQSSNNGNVKVNGTDISVYTHPSTHSADMITDTANKVMMTSAERAKLSEVAANASSVVVETGDSTVPISSLIVQVIED